MLIQNNVWLITQVDFIFLNIHLEWKKLYNDQVLPHLFGHDQSCSPGKKACIQKYWNKIPCVPKYGCHNLASPLLNFLSLWTAFINCCPLRWRYFFQVCSDGSMFHPLSHTNAENPFYFAWTAPNSALNPRRGVVMGQAWANAAPTLKSTYASPKIGAKL